MRLIILRHAIAEELVTTDFERRLTVEGRARCRKVLFHFARRFEAPTIIFSSPLIRARQTARLAARVLGAPVRLHDCLRPQGEALAWLRTQPCEDLMVVGHEPDLSRLAAGFLGLERACFGFKKSGMALLEGQPGQGQLRWLLTPRWLVPG
ncbi:histidine phosphatase family protein [bacterium]|nr:histidine phosphatase family protein [bacterium]